MASRKTDFNTEDIMGSLLGMNKKEKEVKIEDQKAIEEEKENTEPEYLKKEYKDISENERKESIPYPEKESEYIPIDTIRIRRRDEKDMKVPVSFSLSRKMADQLKQIAYVERLSSSEIVSSLIEAYIHAHQDVLNEYLDLINRRR